MIATMTMRVEFNKAIPEKDEDDKNDYTLKIIVVGDLGCGKTSIIKRFVHNNFSLNYKATIGVDFAVKVLHLSSHPDDHISLQLWDIAGQERFGNMTRVFYTGAYAAVVVCDCTRETTFDSSVKWKEDINRKVFFPSKKDAEEVVELPKMLFVNKRDLISDEVATSLKTKLDNFCIEHNFIGWIFTSALDDTGIRQGFEEITEYILNEINEYKTEKEEGIKLDEEVNYVKKCCM